MSVAGAALLRTGRDSWSGEDWRAFFDDDRAGIAEEFDGGLPACAWRPRPAELSTCSTPRRKDPYEAATAALREDTQQWWSRHVRPRPCRSWKRTRNRTPPTPRDLRRFLEGEVLPWFDARKKELANRPLMREQAFGRSLDPDKLERLGHYEVHLDRKLERTLAMLPLRLKDLRREATAGLIRLAKQMAVASCTRREDLSRPCGTRGSTTRT